MKLLLNQYELTKRYQLSVKNNCEKKHLDDVNKDLMQCIVRAVFVILITWIFLLDACINIEIEITESRGYFFL